MAVKKDVFSANMVGEELKNLLRLIEEGREKTRIWARRRPAPRPLRDEGKLVVEADLPGIDPAGIALCMFHGFLTIEGIKRKRQDESEKMNYLCLERSFEPFKRIVRITVPINPKKARAVYARGVLKITFPKVEESRGEPITIKIERKSG